MRVSAALLLTGGPLKGWELLTEPVANSDIRPQSTSVIPHSFQIKVFMIIRRLIVNHHFIQRKEVLK
jgi:hypothetical protein